MLTNKPPMGWNSWNTFGPDINEKLIMETADAMVEKGYLEAGYNYLVIDDGWQLPERVNGVLTADPNKFPNGMKYLADYIHSKGLKFGIYSAAGVLTCLGFPGSFGYEYQDAEMFASWGVDYLKYDICHYPGSVNARSAYLTMSMALRSTGRDIVYSGCTVGGREPHLWMRSAGASLYRSRGDINDSFASVKDIALSQLKELYSSAPGCFNDMDMLIVGMFGKGNTSFTGGCTFDEYVTHFALWCVYGVPLMIGGDVRNMDEDCHKLLTNKELIRINQDEENRPPYYDANQRYARDTRIGVLKLLSNNEFILAYFNFHDEDDLMVPLYFADYGIPTSSKKGLELRDVLTGEYIGIKHDFYCPTLKPHTCKIVKAKFTEEW